MENHDRVMVRKTEKAKSTIKGKLPATTRPDKALGAQLSGKGKLSQFLRQAKKIKPAGDGQGRLIFALDATMSRQPTWDVACEIQAEMFASVSTSGGLAVQLVYFRGFGECRASKWVVRSTALRDLMTRISCKGGRTANMQGFDPRQKRSGQNSLNQQDKCTGVCR
jgi:hypothetical protein